MVKICLDPGHGAQDSGAVLGARYEKNDVLQLALAVKPLLEACGIGVVLTREADAAIGISARCKLANEAGCAYFLSLHRDAAGNPTARGVSIWVHSRADAPTTQKAQRLLDAVLAVAPAYNRRVNKGSANPAWIDYGVNTETDMASALLELGFVTNAEDNARFDTCLADYAAALAKTLCEIVGVPYRTARLTPIMGDALATAAQMRTYLKQRNPAAPELAELYLFEGKSEGVRGDLAFAQSCVETADFRFGGDVKAAQNNFAGLGATGKGEPGSSFSTPQIGIRAQIQHLKGYASTDTLNGACVDPRFKYLANVRGKAPNVEWLGRLENPYNVGWAEGRGYGAAMLRVLDAILATQAVETPTPEQRVYTIDLAALKAQGYDSIMMKI